MPKITEEALDTSIAEADFIPFVDVSDTTQSPQGTTKRITKQDALRGRPFVTVGFSDADYICDGVADDVQIQAAIDSVSLAGGGTVFIKAGTYMIATKVVIPNGVLLWGSGYVSQLKLANSINTIMVENSDTVGGNTNLGLFQLRLNGNDSNQSSQVDLINLSKVSYSIVQNCWIEDSKWAHLTLDNGSFGNTIINNVVTGGNGHGILVSTNCYGNIIEDNQVHDIGDDGGINFGGGTIYGYGIYLFKTGNRNIITNNNVADVNGHGIALAKSTGTGQDKNQVIANTIKNAGMINTSKGHQGIFSDTCSYNLIALNTVEGSSVHGIYINLGSENELKNNTVYSSQQHGILLKDTNKNSLSGNRSYNNGQATVDTYSGILLSHTAVTGTTKYNKITDNYCYDNQGTRTQKHGIRETNTTSAPNQESNYNLIAINYCYNNITSDIVSSGVDNALYGNKITTGVSTDTAIGPALSTDNAIARFDGTTGKLLQNSNVTIGDDGDISVVNAGTTNSISVDQNSNVGTNVATDGAIHIENTDNTDIGLGVYTNIGATASAPLVRIHAVNSAFDQTVVEYQNAGSGSGVRLNNVGTGRAHYIVDTGSTTNPSLEIDKNTSSASPIIGFRIDTDNASTGGAIALDISSASATSGTVIGQRIAAPTGGSANYALNLSDTGGTAAGGITFGTDTTLYRSGANALTTDDSLTVAINLTVTGTSALNDTITIADAKNLVLGTTTGTKIGTATTQKLGFWNVTPVVQPSAYTQTYATASKTHPNATAATLTDNSAGTADTTLEALASGTVYATDVAAIRNNFADLAAMVNKDTADVLDLKKVVNQIIDDLQTVGILS